MAVTWFFWSWISKQERDELTSDELRLLEYHERSHRCRPFVAALTMKQRRAEELRALRDSIMWMCKYEKISREECLRLEIDSLLLNKYGVRLKDLRSKQVSH